MSRKSKIAISCIIILAVVVLGVLAYNGINSIMNQRRLKNLEGNGEKYSVEKASVHESSPLEEMNILYLGSSVTNGSASLGVSFADYIAKRNNTTFLKEAVNGTTLVEGKDSYIERLERVGEREFDLIICQLSTNDATRGLPLGAPSITDTPDKSTVCGAIEYIILYARETWGCPVIFYTNSYYENENYAMMVKALSEIAELYDVGVIDLYSDREFNAISDEERELYMADSIHPTQAGYLEWWTPKIEDYLYAYFGECGEKLITSSVDFTTDRPEENKSADT